MSDYPEQVGASPTPPPTQTSRAGDAAPANVQMISSRRCPNCGTTVPAGSSVCAACGERLETKPRKVRCRQCGGTATSQLVICPHCGRELRAAAPRAVSWGLPLLAALLLLALLVSQWGRLSPFGWLGRQSAVAVNWISEFGASLDPQVAILSAVGEPSVEIVAANGAGNELTGADAVPVTQANPPAVEANSALTTSQVVTALIPTATSLPVNTPPPASTPTDTPTSEPPTATPSPTTTPTTTPTETPTDTPTPQPTNTPPAKETTTEKALGKATVKPTSAAVLTATLSSRLSATPVQTATLSASQEEIQAVGVVTNTTTNTTAITTSVVLTASKSLLPTPTATLLLSVSAPVSTPVSVALSLPTPTPAPVLPTATPSVQFYEVKPGDTVLGIALRFKMEMNDLMLANGLTAQTARLLRPGQKLVIPVIEATDQPADTSSAPTPAGTLYTVRSGDTIVGIAARTGIAVEAILAANRMTAADAPTIQPGDTLVLPAPGATIAPSTPTSTPTPTPTAAVGPSPTPTLTPTATRIPPTPTATPVLLRLPAPTLRSPESGSSVSCAAADKLVWSPVDFVLNTDKYRLHVGYVSGRDAAGNDIVTWVIEQLQPVGLTQWNMDASLCSLAPQELGRQWRWYVDVVEIVDGAPVPVSPPSSVWGFAWN